jgi:hypothetical protein
MEGLFLTYRTSVNTLFTALERFVHKAFRFGYDESGERPDL